MTDFRSPGHFAYPSRYPPHFAAATGVYLAVFHIYFGCL